MNAYDDDLIEEKMAEEKARADLDRKNEVNRAIFERDQNDQYRGYK